MRIHNLTLKNIGPFKEAHLEFIGPDDNTEKPPVVIITGENGTGKTIVIDAIRALFYGICNKIERDVAFSDNFLIQSEINLPNLPKFLFIANDKSNSEDIEVRTNDLEINQLFGNTFKSWRN